MYSIYNVIEFKHTHTHQDMSFIFKYVHFIKYNSKILRIISFSGLSVIDTGAFFCNS